MGFEAWKKVREIVPANTEKLVNFRPGHSFRLVRLIGKQVHGDLYITHIRTGYIEHFAIGEEVPSQVFSEASSPRLDFTVNPGMTITVGVRNRGDIARAIALELEGW